ncbi:MAG: outer membrane protein assembly factor BamA [Bacteroidetes bacterium]|nr:outer membrane protein assembly factor BamA [Bacteroidota bacterium]
MRILLFLTFFLCAVNAVHAQKIITIEDSSARFNFLSPEEFEIGGIRVQGADNFDHKGIILISGFRIGEKIKIPGESISNAIKSLWKEELFSDIQIEVEKERAGTVYLIIKLSPLPKLSRFMFSGINRREADKIREEIALFSGKTITENLVFQTNNKIRGYFREKGFYGVEVFISREKDSLINNAELFRINIKKGLKIGIKKINITGNSSVPNWKLKWAMKDTKQRGIFTIFNRSKFTQSSFEKDKELLLSKYNKIGLRDAEIIHDTVYKLDAKNLIIQIVINEGEKFYFGDIEWIGNTKYRSSYLDTILGIKKGDLFNKTLLQTRLNGSPEGRDISSLYMDRGHLFFNVFPIETNVNKNYINYQIRIIEGKEARNGTITVRGNTKTSDHVIIREIRTKPGDLFNKADIMRTQRELSQLGFFNDQAFQVNPMPNPEKGTVDIEYVVEEKSSDQIELSGGYGGAGVNTGPRIIGTLGLTFNNFSTKKIFKKEAWSPLPGGDGQRLSIRAQSNGTFFQSYTFSFTEPWLGGKKPTSLSYWINHTAISNGRFLRSNPSYSGVGITGTGISLQKRLKWPDDYFMNSYELSYQYYDVLNYTVFPNLTKGYANDIALKYTLQRSSVSAPIYPQSGSNFLLSLKGSFPYSLFEDRDYTNSSSQERYKYLEYFKIKFTGEWYLPLTPDKKLVLMPRFGFGFMGAYNKSKGVTPFDRFSMGGSGLTGIGQIGGREIIALRGYEDQSISSFGGDPIIAKYTLELRYPISLNPSATFYAMVFAEAGNTFPNFQKFNPFNVKKTAGVGIRVFLPMFGMLGLDYGLGFNKLDYWSEGFGKASDSSISTKGFYPKLTFTIGMNLGEL